MNKAPLTRETYTRDLLDLFRFLGERFGLASVDQVALAHLEGYLAHLDGRGLKGTTRRRKVAATRSFFRFCAHKQLSDHDPAAQLIPPDREYHQPRVLTEAEYKRLLEAVRHEPRDAAIIELLLQTGMRRTELSRLTVQDVTLPARISKDEGHVGHVHIQGKGRRERTVTLNWKACKAIKAYLAVRPRVADAHLFITKFGQGIGPRAIQDVVEKYLAEARIVGASVHTLRHTFGTHQTKRGTPLRVVQEALGHASLATTEIYVGLAREQMDKALQENAL
jgi:site-specific recombinase XerD